MTNLSNFTGALHWDLPRGDAEYSRRAARTVASRALTTSDAAELLAMLGGLTARDGLRPPQGHVAP